jgi:hypothetical protein
VIALLPVMTINAVGDVIAMDRTIEELKYMREFIVEK